MKKVLLTSAILLGLTHNALASERGLVDNIGNGITSVAIIKNTDNENLQSYMKSQMSAEKGQARADKAQAALKSLSPEQIEAAKQISVNVGSGTEVSLLQSMMGDAIKYDETISPEDKEAALERIYEGAGEGNFSHSDNFKKLDEAIAYMSEQDKQALKDYIESEVQDGTGVSHAEFQGFQNHVKQEINRLDDRIDGTQASLHAVVNARPQLTRSGQTAVGAGVGFAGEAQAVAVGVGHAFNESWSASATLNVTTGTEDTDVAAGAGVQYAF